MSNRIVGNVVGVPNPKTDWNQTDETKSDFLKNKPDIEGILGKIETALDGIIDIQNQLMGVSE